MTWFWIPDAQQFGSLRWDWQSRSASIDNVPLHLTRVENAMLATLLRQRERIVSKATLIEQSGISNNGNAVEVHLSKLRRLLSGSGVEIRTERGMGYLLTSPEPVPPSVISEAGPAPAAPPRPRLVVFDSSGMSTVAPTVASWISNLVGKGR
jgi:DNA-binding winged helix-turn-helix (wHTH) protein